MPAGESDRTLQYISGAVEFFIGMVGMVSMMVTWVQVIKVVIILLK